MLSILEMKTETRQIHLELLGYSDKKRAESQARYFKTAPGEYGQGDKFLGVRVPDIRTVAERFQGVSYAATKELLRSQWHEERLLALFVLRARYEREEGQSGACKFYLLEKDGVNNWDLVDASAPYILGQENLQGRYKGTTKQLARSSRMWDRRIAIVSTLAFTRQGIVEPAFRMSEKLLGDKEDLMQKATGWMLREAGKQERRELYSFLDEYAAKMPRVMLRYSLEKLPETRRKKYMQAGK